MPSGSTYAADDGRATVASLVPSVPCVRSDRKRHVLRKVKQAYGLYRRSQKEPPASDRDAFIHEYADLKHDPVDFFRRGQIFLSFESDDPAPSYLKAALGTIGEDIACFSGDYGHWDGVLTDCVKNVVRAAEYERPHLAKLLAGNCLRLYGRRLEDALRKHGTLGASDATVARPSSAA